MPVRIAITASAALMPFGPILVLPNELRLPGISMAVTPAAHRGAGQGAHGEPGAGRAGLRDGRGLAGLSPAALGRPVVRDERHRGVLARLADHQDARRPRQAVSRHPVRHARRVRSVRGGGGLGRRAVRAVPGHGAHHPREGELAMASGRPRRPNDPSVMASVETALSGVARPGIFGLIWNWRYELGLSAGLATVALASGYALGAAWLIALVAVGLVLLAAGLAWPPSRRRLVARAWCVITPHRVLTGCQARLGADAGRQAAGRPVHDAGPGTGNGSRCGAGPGSPTATWKEPGTSCAPRAGPATSAWWAARATRTWSCWRSSGACHPGRPTRASRAGPSSTAARRTAPTPRSPPGLADWGTTGRSDK